MAQSQKMYLISLMADFNISLTSHEIRGWLPNKVMFSTNLTIGQDFEDGKLEALGFEGTIDNDEDKCFWDSLIAVSQDATLPKSCTTVEYYGKTSFSENMRANEAQFVLCKQK